MAVTEAYAGSSTIGVTEWSLTNNSSTIASNTVAGAYQVYLDLSAVALADIFELRGYEKVQASDTRRVFMIAHFANTQGTDGAIQVTPTFMVMNGWDFTLKKGTGTDRAISWSIRKAG